MTLSDTYDSPFRSVRIEIDPIEPSGGVLVTLWTTGAPGEPPGVSLVALTGHPHLEELPELLRVLGLACVFGDVRDAHRAVGRLLSALCGG